jgi:hypothetical protein
MLPTTRIDIALCYAVLGKLETAESCSRTPLSKHRRARRAGMRAIVRAVIDCRSDRAAEAAVALEHAWGEHEAMLTGRDPSHDARASCIRGCQWRSSAQPGLVERLLADMRPRYAGELTFLGGTWPQMAAFFSSHRLDR